ncbi:hypothetical protein [Corynebacterium sp.]|uniref:hypothetical protein n=1 Tax=Corynebacterium sp. TaxID=1720 RepID=UPI002A91B42B|nr:hypothetical protein [Corynebacterium sp.]MDY5784638.1 hypothetical protein [Corynebacterium sp.]
MMKRLSATLAAGGLVLAGCSVGEGSGLGTVTITATTYVDAGAPADDAGGAPVAEPGAGAVAQPEAGTVPASQVGGECGTVGDGIRVRAYSATSCEFAMAIYPVAISATYTLQQRGPSAPVADAATGLSVVSPVTGQTYPISCSKSSDGGVLSCRKPDEEKTVGADFSGPTQSYWYSNQSPI